MGTNGWRYAMSIVTLDEFDRFQQMEEVAKLTMQGHTATAISKALNIPRKEVMLLQEDYRIALANDSDARDMARDHLNQMVKNYDRLMVKANELVDDLQTLNFNHNVAGQINGALRLVADLDAKRLDALQKAGLLDSAELGDELADMEEKQQIIVQILRDELCDDCRMKVASKLSKITGRVETTTLDGDVIDDE
jgi:hypothetical protein